MRTRLFVIVLSSALAVAAALARPPDGLAVDPIVPILDCTYHNPTGDLTAVFGYDNPNASALTLPVDVVPANYFAPDPKFRVQPVLFAPGAHHDVFSVNEGLTDQLTWFMWGGATTLSVVADATSSPCYRLTFRGDWSDAENYNAGDAVRYGAAVWVATAPTGTDAPGTGDAWQPMVQGIRVRGEWNTTDTYLPGDVVRVDGSSWVAATTNTNSQPAVPSLDWQLLAQGNPHPAFPSTQVYTFGKGNTATVQDPNVTPSSVIIVQYVNGAGKPTSVNNVTNGSFTATGTTGKSFKYVVYN